MKILRSVRSQLTLAFTAILMCCSLQQSWAQSVQQGITLEYKGSNPKTPMAGVSVTAANAGSVMSGDDGCFELRFRTLRTGDQIQFRRIELNGYEVMNTEALEVARVARQEGNAEADRLPIVMVQSQMLRQLRDGYRSVAVERYKRQLREAEAEAEKLRQQGQLQEQEFNERLDALEADYDEKLGKLETYIDRYARIDLSDLDADEQQIVELVKAGKFDEALQIYDSQNLASRLSQSRAERQKLEEARQQIALAEQQKADENQRLRQSIERQVLLLRMAGGQDNLQKIYDIVRLTFQADTTDWEARRDYAKTLFEKGLTQQSIDVLTTGIALCDDPYGQGMMHLDIMDAYQNIGETDNAYHQALEARSALWPLRETNYQVLSRALPAFTSIEVLYLLEKGDILSCQSAVERVTENWSPDSLNFYSLQSYLLMLTTLSDYYSRTADHKHSLWSAHEAIQLGQKVSQQFPSSTLLNDALANGCSIFAVEGLHDEAVEAARQCSSLWEKVAQKGINRSLLPHSALHYLLMAEAMTMLEDYSMLEAVITSEQQLHIFEQLQNHYPDLKLDFIAGYKLLQVELLLHKGALAEAQALTDKALTYLEQTNDVMASFNRPVFEAKNLLAQGRPAEAAIRIQQAIDICEALYAADNDAWMADNLCQYYLLLASCQAATGDRKAYNKTMKRAERIAVFEIDTLRINNTKNKYHL